MAHIFFEKLEHRRSTQSLYPGPASYNSFDVPQGSFGLFYGIGLPDTPVPPPYYNTPTWTGAAPAYVNAIRDQHTSFNLYSWPQANDRYTLPWVNPISDFGSGMLDPFFNLFQNPSNWFQPSPMPSYPGYQYFPFEIRLLYGISPTRPRVTASLPPLEEKSPISIFPGRFPEFGPPLPIHHLMYGVTPPAGYSDF